MSDSSQNEDITPQQNYQRFLERVTKSVGPLSTALRKHAKGDEADFLTARMEVVQELDAVISYVAPAQAAQMPTAYSPVDLIDGYWDRISKRRQSTATGLAPLNDALNGGFEEDRLVVVLGAPGSGKTTLVNQIADHVAGTKHPVVYITSEDIPYNLLAKTIARRGNIPYASVQRGYPSEHAAIREQLAAYKETDNARFLRYVDATQGIKLDGILDHAMRHFKALESESEGTPVLVVDYLQRLARCETFKDDARQNTTMYVEALRRMACNLHCTIVLLSAMSRSSGYDSNKNAIGAAKESGDIEYTADVILAVGPEGEGEEAGAGMRNWSIRIDKNRQGEQSYDKFIPLYWTGMYQRFAEREAEVAAPALNGNGRYASKRGR